MCWYILLVIGIWIVVSYLSYKNFLVNKKCSVSKEILRRSDNVMFVIAHPDDECMFFGPVITAFTNPCSIETNHRKKAKNIYLLCLSNGDAYGLGKLRADELTKSCKTLGIPEQNVIMHEQSPNFEDDPKKLWNPQLVADTLQLYVKKLRISSIVTFDEAGVSGHLNHKALFHGAQQLKIHTSKKGDGVRVYVLETVNMLRKYSGFLDAIFVKPSMLVATADWQTRQIIQNAMASHASQFVWFRRLYIIFSRYLFINTLLPLEMD